MKTMVDTVMGGSTSLLLNADDRFALQKVLRALRAERDALAAKAPMERKLREYKGAMYNPAEEKPWVLYCKHRYHTAAALIGSLAGAAAGLTDADHAPIYALKSDPYEPIETVEAVLRELANEGDYHRRDASVGAYATRLRAAVAAEKAQGEG